MMLQIGLLLFLVLKMAEKGMKRYLPALGAALAILNPAAAAMSLQFSSIYYIVLISMICVLNDYKKWEEKKRLPYLFFCLGMVTVFFDFLTYPMAALCMPLILVLLMEQKNWKEKTVDALGYGICFAIGFAGMWMGKWVVSSLLLQENVMADAIAQMAVHTGGAVVMGESFTHFGVILRNMKVFFKWPYLLGGVGLVFYRLTQISWREAVKKLPLILPVGVVSLIPFAWLFVTASHAAWCYWYTCRGLMATVFGGFCILWMLPQRKEAGK